MKGEENIVDEGECDMSFSSTMKVSVT